MSVTQKAKDAHAKYKKYKKAKGYYESVKKLLDEDTRSTELFKQGLKGLTKIGEKLFGKGLTKHPYYAYHKKHLELLGQALTASDTHHNALKALATAVEAADSAEGMTKQLAGLKHRKDSLKMFYISFVHTSLQTQRAMATDAALAAQMKADGQDARTVGAGIEQMVFALQANACELYEDSIELAAMVDIEYRAAKAAYKKFTDKVQKLEKSKKSIDVVAGKSAEYKRQLEWAERVLDETFSKKNGRSSDAIKDPSVHAARQLDRVEEVARRLGDLCDAAMSDAVYNPQAFHAKTGGL